MNTLNGIIVMAIGQVIFGRSIQVFSIVKIK